MASIDESSTGCFASLTGTAGAVNRSTECGLATEGESAE